MSGWLQTLQKYEKVIKRWNWFSALRVKTPKALECEALKRFHLTWNPYKMNMVGFFWRDDESIFFLPKNVKSYRAGYELWIHLASTLGSFVPRSLYVVHLWCVWLDLTKTRFSAVLIIKLCLEIVMHLFHVTVTEISSNSVFWRLISLPKIGRDVLHFPWANFAVFGRTFIKLNSVSCQLLAQQASESCSQIILQSGVNRKHNIGFWKLDEMHLKIITL